MLFVTKTTVCKRFGIMDPEGLQAQKYVSAFSPYLNWEFINELYYLAMHNGCSQDAAVDAVYDFYQAYYDKKLGISKVEFRKKRHEKTFRPRAQEPFAKKVQESRLKSYLDNYRFRKETAEDPGYFNGLVAAIKQRLGHGN